jgi:RNA recognition motif-containing protein
LTQERKGFLLKNIYVGNLPYNTSDNDLHDLFSQAGSVISARVITDRDTRQSRGFGFVEMDSSEDAAKAISQFNGYSLGDRSLTVNEAKPRNEGGPRRY